jgi:hypothetical protein
MKKIEFSNKQLEEIIKLYTDEHYSMKKIGEQFGVSKTVISRVLNENKVQIKNDNHKYYADYRKFENIDSNEKAYWLGFIAADGCIYQRQNSSSGNFIVINIHRKDKNHLEKFRKFMDSNVNIVDHIQTEGFSNNTPMSKIIFNSNLMVQDFIDKGVVPKKSLILEPPKIEEEYFLPFILGYFDGDGSIFQTSNGEFGIDIVGTKEILEWINSILNISNKLEKRNNDNKNNYYIRCGGFEKPYNIMKKLYDNSIEHLDRKFDIYNTLETVVLSRNTK